MRNPVYVDSFAEHNTWTVLIIPGDYVDSFEYS